MKPFKQISVFSVLLFFSIQLAAQSSDSLYKLWVIPDTGSLQKVNQGWTGNQDLNDLLDSNNVTYYEKAFPSAKTPKLQRVYKIECDGCDLSKLADAINDSFPNYYETAGAIKYQNIVLHDPQDWFWQSPDDDTRWHLELLDASKAWDITLGDPDVHVGLIDTYFDLNDSEGHPDLKGEFKYDYDPYLKKERPNRNAKFTNCNKAVSGDFSHGSTVASFLSGDTRIPGQQGDGQVASIGHNTKMIGYKAWEGDYLAKALHASNEGKVEVLTSSAGGWNRCPGGYTTKEAEAEIQKLAVKEILNNGTTIVMPAGNGDNGTHKNCPDLNEGTDYHNATFPLSPYYDDRVIIVSSTGENDKHFKPNGLTHSHYPSVDLCAPGYNVKGAKATDCGDLGWPYTGGDGVDGTSYATPIVAGVASLMYSVNPCLSPSMVQSILKCTTDPIQDADNFPGLVGSGRVNAHKAVKAAKEAKSQQSGDDLFLKDIQNDFGEEPSAVGAKNYDNSPDIWVRHEQENYDESGYHKKEHQSPAFGQNPNYVYVEVRNRSCDPYNESNGEEIALYWSKQSGWFSWPDNWDGSGPQNDGDQIGSISIPELEPGQSEIIEFKWNIPDPTVINKFSVCLLARIEGISDDGITVHQGRLDEDVRNNNNIAMKNIDIHDVLPGEPNVVGLWDENLSDVYHPHGRYTLIGNPNNTATQIDVEIAASQDDDNSLTDDGEVNMVFNDSAWSILSTDIQNTEGLKVIEAGKVQVLDDSVVINNINFPANTRVPVFLDFNILAGENTDQESYGYHIRQYLSSSGTYTGGVHHTINENGENPDPVGLPNDKEINLGESVTIQLDLQLDTPRYNWYNGDGNLIDSGNSLTVSPNTTTNYELEFISHKGYKAYESIQVVVNESWIENMYPNPASNTVTVEYEIQNSTDAYLKLVNDATGYSQQIPIENTTSGQKELNLSDLQNGSYTMLLYTDGTKVDEESLLIE